MKVVIAKELAAKENTLQHDNLRERGAGLASTLSNGTTGTQVLQLHKSAFAAGRDWIWPAATIAIVCVAYGPMIWQFCVNQWARGHYQYFPFVMGAFLWLLWRNGRNAQTRSANLKWIKSLSSVALLSSAWVLLGLAYLAYSPWLAIISAILLIGSRLVSLSRGLRIEYLFGIWLMLWLIVPLPMNRDQQLISNLQELSSRVSSIILDAVGVEHLMEGNALLLPDKQFFVDEACSGIVSVLSVIACAVIYGIWRNRRPVHVVILAVAGVGWATVMNVMRITIIAIAYDHAGHDWSTGTSHEILGLLSFTVIFLGLVSTDLLLVGMLAPIGPALHETLGAPSPIGLGYVRIWDWLLSSNDDDQEQPASAEVGVDRFAARRLSLGLVSLSAFALLPIFNFANVHLSAADLALRVRPQVLIDNALACNQSTLPAVIGKLSFVKFTEHTRSRDDQLGNFSRTFEYRDAAGNEFMVSCDFPYEGGWHELTLCYEGIGWGLTQRRIDDETIRADESRWTSMEADFSKPDGTHALLVASAFDESGKPIALPTYTLLADAWRKLTNKSQAESRQLAFQIQVWTMSNKPIGDEHRRSTRQLLQLAREHFHDAIMKPRTSANKDEQNSH